MRASPTVASGKSEKERQGPKLDHQTGKNGRDIRKSRRWLTRVRLFHERRYSAPPHHFIFMVLLYRLNLGYTYIEVFRKIKNILRLLISLVIFILSEEIIHYLALLVSNCLLYFFQNWLELFKCIQKAFRYDYK